MITAARRCTLPWPISIKYTSFYLKINFSIIFLSILTSSSCQFPACFLVRVLYPFPYIMCATWQAHLIFFELVILMFCCRSQWPHGLRRVSAATRLLGLWVQIPPTAWRSVSCECCVLSVEVSATGWSRGVLPSVVCLKKKPRKMRRPRPPRGCRAMGEKKIFC